MRYLVYTDAAASTQKRISGCAYVIFTDKMYITSESVKVSATYNPTHAEVVSIGLAAAYIVDNMKVDQGDTVTIFSDCLSAIDFCKAHLDSGGSVASPSKVVRNSILVLRQLSEMCKVNFQKVHGHKDAVNPNMFVDRLAKLPLRRE